MATKFYSTSDVAQMCNVHRNTIIAAIRQGKLRAYKTPGGHARIAHADLLTFCKERGLPISQQVSRNDKVLIVSGNVARTGKMRDGLEAKNYRVRVAADLYEAGFLTVASLPDVLLLDLDFVGEFAESITQRIRRSKPTRNKIKLLAFANARDAITNELFAAGVDDFLAGPLDVDKLIEHVVDLVGPIDGDIPIRDESQLDLTPLTL
ncbi:MAG: helix-turn-helix domain-containing protein [Planctomycetota bacterium]